MLKSGTLVFVKGDDENTQYKVVGENDGLFWLSVTDLEYDGYDGQLIVALKPEDDERPRDEGDPQEYCVVLADERSDLPGVLELLEV